MGLREDRQIISELDRIHGRYAETAENLLNSMVRILEVISKLEAKMALLDDLTREVAENNSVMGSAIALIQGLRDQVAALKASAQAGASQEELTAQINALAVELDTNTAKLAGSLVESTPVENQEPVPVQEEPVIPVDPTAPPTVEPAPPAPEVPTETPQ